MFSNQHNCNGCTEPSVRSFKNKGNLHFEIDLDIHITGPLHTQDWEPVTITLQALSLVEKVGPVQVRFTLRLMDQRRKWMQDGCRVYVDSYMASNGSCFMLTWIIFKNHLLEVGLAQNRETMTLQTFTTVDLFYSIMCEDHA